MVKIRKSAVFIVSVFIFCVSVSFLGAESTQLQKQADTLISQGEFAAAAEVLEQIMKSSPRDYETALKLARIYSWISSFERSLFYYDKAVSLGESSVEPYVEKARVLGWQGENKISLETYEKAYALFGLDWIKYEKLAKENLWAGRTKAALDGFDRAIEANGGNVEILFDAGQIYSHTGDYKKAKSYYERILAINPYHTSARAALEKNSVLDNAAAFDIGADFWSASSLQRNTDADSSAYRVSLKKNIDKYYIGFDFSEEVFRYEDADDIMREFAGVSAGYAVPMLYGLGGGLSAATMPAENLRRYFHYFYSWFKPAEQITSNVTFVKHSNIGNRENILKGLEESNSSIRISWAASGVLNVGADYSNTRISDGNSRNAAGADTLFFVTKTPRRIYLEKRIENQSYTMDSAAYFSPSHYTSYIFAAGIRHDIGKGGNVFGSDKIFYDIKYKVTLDSNGELSQSPGFVFCADISSRLNIRLAHAISRSYYYNDNLTSFRLSSLF